MSFRGNIAEVSLIIVCLSALGCSQQTIDSADSDAKHDAAVLQQDAKHVEAEAKPDLVKLGIGARVTAALKANQNLPSTIRVDADTDGVSLRGTVRDADQKALAGRIARDTLSKRYKVENDLNVKE